MCIRDSLRRDLQDKLPAAGKALWHFKYRCDQCFGRHIEANGSAGDAGGAAARPPYPNAVESKRDDPRRKGEDRRSGPASAVSRVDVVGCAGWMSSHHSGLEGLTEVLHKGFSTASHACHERVAIGRICPKHVGKT
eukprot:2259249-Rhodomonas_salina.1